MGGSDLIVYEENIPVSKHQNCTLSVVIAVESELLLSHSENWDEMGNKGGVLQGEGSKGWVVQDQGPFLKLACVQAMGRGTVADATVQRSRRRKKTSI